MIETLGEPFADVDRQVKFKLVASTRRRIRPDGLIGTAVTWAGRAARSRQSARATVEES